MVESESKDEKPEKQRRLDPELLKKGLRCDLGQYKMLKRCSDAQDMTEWNKWRRENRSMEIFLEGARFSHAHFEKADLRHAVLKGAYLQLANLEGADFSYSDLRGAHLPFCPVDGSTIFFQCEINQHTWFYGVGLDNVRIEPAIKQLLEYNIRRRNWQKWYWGNGGGWWLETTKEKRIRIIRAVPRLIFTFPVRIFWSFSKYGLSTWRLIEWFFGLAIAFALVYRLLPNCVIVNDKVGDIRGFWHMFYFSVVTMTTLGFGDIAANPDSWCGQTLLMVQVILGYVLLGALVTRFAVLFTAGGPAGKFADDKKKATEE